MSKRDELRQRRRQREQRNKIIGISLAAVLVLALLGAFILPDILIMQNIVKITPGPAPQAQGMNMGDPNAPVKVEVFSDFQCPICKTFAEEIAPAIVNDYVATGKVYLSYAPMAFIGQESVNAAKAAFCASEQNKFWEYHDILFANQTGENIGDFSTDRLEAFARAIKLDRKAYNTCTADTTRYDEALSQTDTRARDNGITGTPSFIVNGKMVADYRTLVTEINQALAGQ